MNVFADSQSIEKNIRSSLRKSLPKVNVDKITNTPVPNIYEITSNKKIFYVDGGGKYLFIGNLIDLSTRDNLTQAAAERLSTVDWNQIPLTIALRKVNGDGRYKISVFTDPDCPFCKRLEAETIPKINNTTIYYFLFPLSIHPSAEDDSKKILCSETPDSTYLNWMIDDKTLPIKATCNNANRLIKMKQVGKQIGVEVTPTIVLPNGKVVTGLVPADYLNQLIHNSVPYIESRIESK